MVGLNPLEKATSYIIEDSSLLLIAWFVSERRKTKRIEKG
jgi:hypothetical protein